jgi:protein subunit release factor B
LQHIPSTITAGTSVDLSFALTAYPPSGGWSLVLYLRGPDAIDLASAPDGDLHRITAAATTSAAWSSGTYWASLRAEDGADVIEVEAGQIEIAPDLAQEAQDYDGRDHVEKVLAAIEAVIECRASKDQERYRINNRELQRTPLDQLMQLRDRYRAEARRARAARKGQSLLGRPVRVRF